MRLTKRNTILLAVAAVIIAAGAIWYFGFRSTSTTPAYTLAAVEEKTVTDTVETTGNLSAARLSQLKWGTTGVIEEVSVQVGDKVKKDDRLASLLATSVSSDVITAQANLASAQQDLDNLTKSGVTLAQAVQNVLEAKKNVEEAENVYTALDYPKATDLYLADLQRQIHEADKQVSLTYATYKTYIKLPDWNEQKNRALNSYVTAKNNYDTLVATYNFLTAKPTDEDRQEAKADLDLARAQWEDAKRQRDLVKNGVDPLTLAGAEARVKAAEAAVNAMYIIAPFNGEVLAVQATAGNSAAKDGNALVLVDKQTLQIDTQVDESQVGSVKLGDLAAISMDSLPGVTLTGKVSMINPIGSIVNGLVKYTVTVAVDPTDEPVLFGATATVVITTGEPHSELLVPLNAVKNDSSSEYVMVQSGPGGFTRIDVTTGSLFESMVVVFPAGDLKAGDMVQVSSSSTSSSSTRGGFGMMGGGPPPGE